LTLSAWLGRQVLPFFELRLVVATFYLNLFINDPRKQLHSFYKITETICYSLIFMESTGHQNLN